MVTSRPFSSRRRGLFHRHLDARFFILALLASILVAPAAAQTSTTTTLTLSAASVPAQTVVTLTASASAGGSALTTGLITFCDASATFCDNAAQLGTVPLTGAGTAVLKLIPSIGSHSYKAIFNATAADASSTSAAQTLTVTGLYPTTTSITSSGAVGNYGLTATVSSVASTPPVLSGTVSFEDTTNNNFLLGTATLGLPAFTQSFTPAGGSPFNTGVNPAAVGTGDFNGDGIPDLAVMNSGDNTVTIMLGSGNGAFTTVGTPIPVGTTPCIITTGPSNCSLAVGDFNHDGTPDLAVTSGGDNTVSILLGNGTGGFAEATASPILVGAFPEAVITADFNKDGIQDLAVANANDNTVSILLGNGDGTFTPATGSPVAVGNFPFFLASADFNADGNTDLAVVNGVANTLTVLLGNGDGTFTAAAGSPIAVGSGASPVVAGDFNGDGKPDLAVANYNDDDVDVLLGNGDGTFTAAANSPVAVGTGPFAMALGDLNEDGNADLAVVNYAGQTLTVLLGDGTGGFAAPNPATTLGNSPNALVIADFNGDGTPDIAIPELADNNLTVLLNQVTQTSTASLANVSVPGTGTHLVDASYSGATYFAPSISSTVPLLGSTAPTTLTLTATPAQQLVTMPVVLTAQMASVAGVPTGSVSFFDGGTLLASAPIGVNGQATYTTTALALGTHSITATYAGNIEFLPSSSPAAVTVTISDFTITLTGGNTRTILPGTTVMYTFQVAPVVATTFLYDVNFTASGLPAGATYAFSPPSLAAGTGETTVTLTIQTANTAALNTIPARPGPPPYGEVPLTLGLLFPLLISKRIRRRIGQMPGRLMVFLLAALSLAAVAGLSGCSNAGFFAQQKITYTVGVTATSGTVQRSASTPLTVQ